MVPDKGVRRAARRVLGISRVVGAGLGERRVANGRSPVLTIMVDGHRPGDDIRIADALGCGDKKPVEILDVGKVVALGADDPKG